MQYHEDDGGKSQEEGDLEDREAREGGRKGRGRGRGRGGRDDDCVVGDFNLRECSANVGIICSSYLFTTSLTCRAFRMLSPPPDPCHRFLGVAAMGSSRPENDDAG